MLYSGLQTKIKQHIPQGTLLHHFTIDKNEI